MRALLVVDKHIETRIASYKYVFLHGNSNLLATPDDPGGTISVPDVYADLPTRLGITLRYRILNAGGGYDLSKACNDSYDRHPNP